MQSQEDQLYLELVQANQEQSARSDELSRTLAGKLALMDWQNAQASAETSLMNKFSSSMGPGLNREMKDTHHVSEEERPLLEREIVILRQIKETQKELYDQLIVNRMERMKMALESIVKGKDH